MKVTLGCLILLTGLVLAFVAGAAVAGLPGGLITLGGVLWWVGSRAKRDARKPGWSR